jgi:hypothetical protein
MQIEPLEQRIAPAAALFTYMDLDGDLVKVTATGKAGAPAPPLDATDFAFVGGGAAGQLAKLTLTEAGFDGAKIVFSVTKSPGGDGLAHAGVIDATLIDLDQVVVKGDLGRILVGDNVISNDPGLNLLQVRTFGTLGGLTQEGLVSMDSVIQGKLGALKVAGDFGDATLLVDGDTNGQIGMLAIGGDLVGGTITAEGGGGAMTIGGNLMAGADGAGGSIVTFFGGHVASITIGESVIGGSQINSGRLNIFGNLGSLKIKGDLLGNDAVNSGSVFTDGSIGSTSIGGDVVGGRGASSGQVFNFGIAPMGNVTIGGDLRGGPAEESGFLFASGSMGKVAIKGDMVGGSIKDAETVDQTGCIQASNGIASVTIGGSLIAGYDESTGTLTRSGAIISGLQIGPVKIGGSIVGNETNAALISGFGAAMVPAPGQFDTAIASVTVKGDVRFAEIRAGFSTLGTPINGDGALGAISVGGDWVASSAVAGAQDMGAPGWGVGDTLLPGGNVDNIARIASITIKGDLLGSAGPGGNFGFVAERIDKFSAAGRTYALTPGTSNDNFALPFTDDVHLLEVS